MIKEIMVSGKLETSDVRTFMMFHNYSQMGGALTGILGVISLLLTPILLFQGDWLSGVILGMLGLMYGVITPIDLISKARRQIHLNPVFKNKMTYRFDENVFKMQLYTGATEMPWHDVYQVKMLKAQILIYLEKQQALIVPKRYFACDDDVALMDDFFTTHQLYLPKSRRLDVEDEQEDNS